MSWITTLWPMMASAFLSFALLHLFIWAKGIQTAANLSFAIAAFAAAVITGMELIGMRAVSIEQMAIVLRWTQLPVLVIYTAIFYFVRRYFNAGRSWLAWTGIGLGVLALILGFTSGQTLFFKEITGLKQVTVLGGETISVVQGSLNPWSVTGPLSTLALAAFVLNAAFTLWREGSDTGRRRAIVFGGGIALFLAAEAGHIALVNAGVIDSPYIVALSLVPILFAMSYELNFDLLRSARLAHQLQASDAELRNYTQRMRLAASAAGLRLWEWDIVQDEIWTMDKDCQINSITAQRNSNFDNFLNSLHDEDRERVRRAVEKSMAGNGDFECEYRINMPDGQTNWFNSHGRIEFSENNQPLRMFGVTVDITRHKQAEFEAQQQRNELTHLSRVTMLGELSGSLAHELNQPLAAILSNAQAAIRFLANEPADLAEVRDILNDIVAEDRRAADIIHSLRLLLKKCEVQHLLLVVNTLVEEVLKLVNSDLVNHNVTVNVDLEQELPAVSGDGVQLQQVLLNLIMNACEAMSHTKASQRRLFVRTELAADNHIKVTVGDQGPGISAENLENIFKPFFTTKLQGMGMGLAICRTIIAAHGGQLWASNNTGSGAAFHFTLPASPGEST